MGTLHAEHVSCGVATRVTDLVCVHDALCCRQCPTCPAPRTPRVTLPAARVRHQLFGARSRRNIRFLRSASGIHRQTGSCVNSMGRMAELDFVIV